LIEVTDVHQNKSRAAGRPEVNDRRAIAVDIGGSKTALGVVGADGSVSRFHKISNSDDRDYTELLESVSRQVGKLRADAEAELNIGVAICELVSTEGEICSANSIPWTRADVLNALSPHGRVVLDADVRASGLAEAMLGAGRPFNSFVHLTIGTGISCCLVRNGVPDPGAHGFAGLIGSTPLIPNPGSDATTNLTLEDIAAGPALLRTHAERTQEPLLAAEGVIALARSGDGTATAVIKDAATTLGAFVALLVNVFDPEAVVVGGGLGSADGLYWDTAVSEARALIWPEPTRSLPILHALLGPNAALIGAGLAALTRI
jgi:glucokinase